MKTHLWSLSRVTLLALSVGLTGCSKKTEPANPPAQPAPAPTASTPAPSLADAAQARVDAAQKEIEAAKAQAEAAAKTKAAELQAQAEQKAADAQRLANDLKAQGASQANALLSNLGTQKADAPGATSAATSTISALPPLTQNLSPANFSAWYEKASAESSGIIASLATKAAELGGQASPEFKSLYDTALAQKKTFDEVSTQLKAGGLTQWATLYPKLQTSWTDLSKSLTDAKALLARFQK